METDAEHWDRVRRSHEELREHQRQELFALAAAEGVVLVQDPHADGFHFLYTPPGWDQPGADLWQTMVGWRIAEGDGFGYTGRYWCYGPGNSNFVTAVRAMRQWAANPEGQPTGWYQSYNWRREEQR